MPLINWNDKYSVSVPEMDRQHKKLINMINNLNDAMKAGKGSEIIGKILSDMVAYTRTHFNEEERMLAAAGYDGLNEQKKLHASFVRKLIEFKSKYDSGQTMISIEIMDFLSKWLTGHIMEIDKRYSTTLAPTT
jgi:hemerythrin-like metal-binding protein